MRALLLFVLLAALAPFPVNAQEELPTCSKENTTCPAGRTCYLSKKACVRSCTTDQQCGTGSRCAGTAAEGKYCVKRCTKSSECALDSVCDTSVGLCYYDCRVNDDKCHTPGTVCQDNGLCRPPTAPGTTISPGTGSAPPSAPGTQPSGATTLTNPLKNIDSLPDLLHALLKAVVQIGFIVLTLALVYVGFLFVTAQGNEEKLRSARSALVWTIIGGLILLGAEAISLVIQATVEGL